MLYALLFVCLCVFGSPLLHRLSRQIGVAFQWWVMHDIKFPRYLYGSAAVFTFVRVFSDALTADVNNGPKCGLSTPLLILNSTKVKLFSFLINVLRTIANF